MGLFSRKGNPARAIVVPRTVEIDPSLAEMLQRVNSKTAANVGLVPVGGTGMQRVTSQLPMWVIQVLRDLGSERPLGQALPPQLEVPVVVDPGTDKIKKIDRDALVDELAAVREVASQTWRDENGLTSPLRTAAAAPGNLFGGLQSLKDDLTAGVADIFAAPGAPATPRPTDATHPPIEGVGYDTWIRANIALGRGQVSSEGRVAHFESVGFPVGRVEEVDAAWFTIAKSDPGVGQWYGHDYRNLDTA